MIPRISKTALTILRNPQASRALAVAMSKLYNGETVTFTTTIGTGNAKKEVTVVVKQAIM